MPCQHELLLGIGHVQVITVMHVEVQPSDHAFDFISGFHRALAKANFDVALTMPIGFTRQDTEAVTGPVSIHFTDGRGKIVHISFHDIKHWVSSITVLPPTVPLWQDS